MIAAMFAATTLRADEQIREIQEQLRKRHLFYHDIDGRYTSDVANALKRYQEHKGFAPTGIPDDETLKSLGIAGVAAPAELPDEPVLKSDLGPSAPPPPVAPQSPLAVTFTSSKGAPATRAEAASFVRHYFDACQSRNVYDELGFYSERVNYFDHGPVDKTYIKNELAAYDQHWPERKYLLGNSIRVQNRGDKTVVRFRVGYNVANPARDRKAAGKTYDTLVMSRASDSEWKIVSIEEARIRTGHRYRSNPFAVAAHRVHGFVRSLLP